MSSAPPRRRAVPDTAVWQCRAALESEGAVLDAAENQE